MWLDDFGKFADGLAVTASGEATNVVPLSVAKNNLGVGEAMVVLIDLVVAADDADANETYVIRLLSDSVSTQPFPSPTVVGTVTIPRGSVAGSRFYINVPPNGGLTEEFIGVDHVLGGTTPSMTYSAWLIPLSFIQNEQVYPDNITIAK